MGMNYHERIVFNDMKGKGFDLIKVDNKGYPDFKVINFKTGETFYIEVKTIPTTYLQSQKKMFNKIDKKILVAIVNQGKIEYTNYKTKLIEFVGSYSQKLKEKFGDNIQCKKCEYKWYTTSEKMFVSCPSCLTKNEVKKRKP